MQSKEKNGRQSQVGGIQTPKRKIVSSVLAEPSTGRAVGGALVVATGLDVAAPSQKYSWNALAAHSVKPLGPNLGMKTTPQLTTGHLALERDWTPPHSCLGHVIFCYPYGKFASYGGFIYEVQQLVSSTEIPLYQSVCTEKSGLGRIDFDSVLCVLYSCTSTDVYVVVNGDTVRSLLPESIVFDRSYNDIGLTPDLTGHFERNVEDV